MIDALGFKGIWQREDVDPVQLAAKLQGMRNDLMTFRDTRKENLRAIPGDLKFVAQFLSDTFIYVSAFDPEQESSLPDELRKQMLVHLACEAAAHLIRWGLQDEPYLAFRGSIAVGDVWVTEHVVLGPAVESAATWYEQADAGVVWLTREARKLAEFTHTTIALQGRPFWFEGEVPLKNDSKRQKRVPIRTFIVDAQLEDRVPRKPHETYAKRLLATFDTSTSDEVRIKRRNTQTILAAKGIAT